MNNLGRNSIVQKALGILKRFLTGYFFESLEEEIHFFKNVKPLFYSKFIYYIKVYNYHIKKPVGSEQVVSEFITTQLSDLKHFFDHNQAFYQYYRSGSTHLDTCYFTRGNFDVYAEIEDFQGDETFSTSHDYKISKVIANGFMVGPQTLEGENENHGVPRRWILVVCNGRT